MNVIQVEYTRKGASVPKTLRCRTRAEGMELWDKYVNMASGGDVLRLVNLETGHVLSTYQPVDRSLVSTPQEWADNEEA